MNFAHSGGATHSLILRILLAAYGVVTLAACTPAQTTSHDAAPTPVATAAPAPSTSPVQNDGDFVKSAVQIELGRYALGVAGLKRAHARELRALAKQVSSDGSASNRWLVGFARKHRIRVPSHPNLRATYQYSRLVGLSGAAFDRVFAQSVVVDASLALDTYKQELRNTKDAALRDFVKVSIPKLESSEKSAQKYFAKRP
ncbi:MAG: DUF4142 domain-containing protein [Candidatus Eremiobacteraeota bacterium]|nr:DUF4142 domain-containing protein [Candidatus Eremiobacteraeota bacterium]